MPSDIRPETQACATPYLSRYAYTISLRRRDWAWEFLRRNPKFIEQAYEGYSSVERLASCIPGGKVLRTKTQQNKADFWGLLFFPNPDQIAPKADIFWVPELDPCVVPMVVSQRSIHEKDEMFAEVMEACTIDVFQDEHATEHLLTRGKFATAQSLCFGKSLLSGESVKLNLHIQSPDHVDFAYNAYRRASAILHVGPWQWTERTQRLRNALVCLDVKDAGLSLRHAAEIILGEERVAEEWNDNKSLRDRIRSCYRTGLRLRDGGYKQLFRSAPIDAVLQTTG